MAKLCKKKVEILRVSMHWNIVEGGLLVYALNEKCAVIRFFIPYRCVGVSSSLSGRSSNVYVSRFGFIKGIELSNELIERVFDKKSYLSKFFGGIL